MHEFTLSPDIVDRRRRGNAVRRLRELRVALPTFGELAEPHRMPASVARAIATVGCDQPDPRNLWRVHWYNDETRSKLAKVPGHLVLPERLTGVKAKIVVALGARFPLIGAHKVLAAYACLVPRLVTGRFDPTTQKAIWPSTGNYCRGGIAISRILGCRGAAVLPTGMSAERFEWLERWVGSPEDIIRTEGSESNVKEIYDKCAELARRSDNVVLNQFSEFSNYLIHYLCTGNALEQIYQHLAAGDPQLRLAAFVFATGSAGTLAAGDYLKSRYGTGIAAVEALECPTMLCNGYGAHNIQGIGDKHIPLIHNVMNTDYVVGVSDRSSDGLNLLFNSGQGQAYLTRRQSIDPDLVGRLGEIGISGNANIVAAIKMARHLDLGPSDVVITVATDSAALYRSERAAYLARRYPNGFDEVNAGECFGQHLQAIADDHVVELTFEARRRILNLGYYTWVEQQGIAIDDFDRRKNPSFWSNLRSSLSDWDQLIAQFNEETGSARPQ